MTSNNNSTDDGSLSFLNIQPDEANKHFNCPETTQQKLINLQFWLIDFIEDVKTKFGANRRENKVQEGRPRKRSKEVLHKFQRNKIHFAGNKEA